MASPNDLSTINNDLAYALSMSRVLKFGSVSLQLKRLQIFDREFWDNMIEHVHPFFELTVILRGKLRYSIENHYVQLDSNRKVLLIPSGVSHTRSLVSKNDLIVIIQFSMEPSDESGTALLDDLRTVLSKRHYELYSFNTAAIESILQFCGEHPPLWMERLLNRLENFLLEFFVSEFKLLFTEKRLPQKILLRRGIRIRNLEQLVEITLDTHLHLEEYAARLGISTRQIERLVKQYHGMSFSQYVRLRRVEAAKKMLCSPFVSIKDVASSLGYDNLSHFCRIFKLSVGISPGEYIRHTHNDYEG